MSKRDGAKTGVRRSRSRSEGKRVVQKRGILTQPAATKYELPNEAEHVLQVISVRTGKNADELLTRAVGLLDLVVGAQLTGHQVLITNFFGETCQRLQLNMPIMN